MKSGSGHLACVLYGHLSVEGIEVSASAKTRGIDIHVLLVLPDPVGFLTRSLQDDDDLAKPQAFRMDAAGY